MRLGIFNQQPREALFYSIDYSCWLDATIPEALNDVEPLIIITPSTEQPLVVTPETIVPNRVRLLISGGVDGTTYKVEVIATTDAGQTQESEVTIRVRDY